MALLLLAMVAMLRIFDYETLGYPAIDRLGINWQVDSHIGIKGDAYFALTPAAMMAGGGLSATFDAGIIKAWFTVDVEFLDRVETVPL